PGILAGVLAPLAEAGANLRVVMGYGMGNTGRAAIEVYPVSGKRVTAAASSAGLRPSAIACLLVEGDDRAGLGAAMARGIAALGINVAFVMAENVGRRFSAVFGFHSEADAANAAKAIKGASKVKKSKR